MASVFAGGLSPLTATFLLSRSEGKPWPVSLYMVGLALVTLVSVYLSAETFRGHLTESAPTAPSAGTAGSAERREVA
jgi:MHS family shikimate/dehydroshikimate transporter-like MFS transporter